MLNSGRFLTLVALLMACAASSLANPILKLEEEEARLMGKYGKLLEKSNEPTSAAEKELLKKYSQLSAWLETELPNSLDLQENIEAASKFHSESLADASSSFSLLNQVTGNWDENKKMCSSHSEQILRLNRNVAWALGPGSRVYDVVKKVAENHAQACQRVYPIKYHEKLGELDEDERANLFDTIADEDLAGWMAHDPSMLVDIMYANDPAADVGSDWQRSLTRRLFVALKNKAAATGELDFIVEESPRQQSVDAAKFRTAYDNFLRKPCAKFVKLEADVYGPASFDLSVSKAPLLNGQMSEKEILFALGFFRYETCKMLLDDKRNAFENAVAKAINI